MRVPLLMMFFTAISICQGTEMFNCDYLGEQPPEDIPIIFNEGTISTSIDEYNFEISPQGNAMVFARSGNLILVERNDENGVWSEPHVASFSSVSVEGEPCFSPIGTQIYFSSQRPLSNSKHTSNIWVSKNEGGVWSDPKPVAELIPLKKMHAITVSSIGNIYDSGLIRFIKDGKGKYSNAASLNPETKGSHPYVSPDESYIIFSARRPGSYTKDLFIIYRKPDNTWTLPKSVGASINSTKNETSPYVTPDNQYLFFGRNYDVYWVRANFINDFKPQLK